MQCDDRGALERREAHPEGRFELRRQVDFRHENERLGVGLRRQNFGQRAQIHFSLTAARHAVQQEGGETVRIADCFDGARLLVGQRG